MRREAPKSAPLPRVVSRARWYCCRCESRQVTREITVSDHTIRAADYCGPDDGAVDSAMRIAASILEAMKSNEKIFVSMESIPVASSSFFNVIFSELAAKLGS